MDADGAYDRRWKRTGEVVWLWRRELYFAWGCFRDFLFRPCRAPPKEVFQTATIVVPANAGIHTPCSLL
jgi:hypothetical protein